MGAQIASRIRGSAKRYYAAKRLGICTQCRKRKAEEGKLKCRICLKKNILSQNKHRILFGIRK